MCSQPIIIFVLIMTRQTVHDASYYYLTNQQINMYVDTKYLFEFKWFYYFIKKGDGKCKRVEDEGAEAVQKSTVCQQNHGCLSLSTKDGSFQVFISGVV